MVLFSEGMYAYFDIVHKAFCIDNSNKKGFELRKGFKRSMSNTWVRASFKGKDFWMHSVL